MSNNLEHALHYAIEWQWPVFPCKIDKKPMGDLVPNGFKNASLDPEQIRDWWKIRNNASIGVPTGTIIKVWVLDVDREAGGFESLAKIKAKYGPLPETMRQKTGGGGEQHFFLMNGQVPRNSTSKLKLNDKDEESLPGIDVRGEGGYVIVPESGHPTGGVYRWENDVAPVVAPQWLMDMVMKASKKEDDPPARQGSPSPLKVDGGTPYGRRALAEELEVLARAPDHTRNDTLNRCTFSLAQLVAGGELDEAEVKAALDGMANSIGLDRTEIPKTIDSAFKAGMQSPRSAPERSESPSRSSEKSKPWSKIVESETVSSGEEEQEEKAEAPGPEDVQDTINPLVFPDIMDGVAGEFAGILAKYLEPPKHFFFMSYLACLGNVATGRLFLNTEINAEPRMYLLLLGESSDDRKSTAIDKVVSFFRSALTDFPVCHGIGSAEGLQKVLSGTERLLLVFDEFRAFVSKCKIESSVLMPAVSTLYESKFYENHTAKKSVKIENASLSLLAASTIDTYEGIFDEHFLAIGFPNRIFLCPGKGGRKFSLPERIPEYEWQHCRRQLGEMLDLIDSVRSISITPEGYRLYHTWYMNLPQSVHAKRLESYAMRLMPLLAVNSMKTVVDEDTIRKVIELMDWQYRVRRRFDPIDADSVMARTEEKIRRVLETGPKTKRELSRAIHAHRIGLWVFNEALKNLRSDGQITLGKKKYELNDEDPLEKCHPGRHRGSGA